MFVRTLILLLVFSATVFCNPAQNTHEEIPFRLGNREIKFQRISFDGSTNFFVIQLHHNERTAARSATKFLADSGGTFFSLQNAEMRLVDFALRGKKYRFDPNRIFTAAGVKETLKDHGRYERKAAIELSLLAKAIIAQLPSDSIISVHNNTDGAYSILSYLPGGKYAGDAAEIHVNEMHDADDFFLTTNSFLFNRLKEQNFNVILQNNSSVTDDGSLSVYCGQKGMSYVNVEAQHDHEKEQLQMLKALAITWRKN